MLKQFKIDPWKCMPLLGTVEFFKDSNFGHQSNSQTKNGYQPLMDNPITWPQFESLYQSVKTILDHELEFDWQIHRSWVISYNFDGWQDSHTHHNSLKSCVLCLIGDPSTGLLEFETGETVSMSQGDLLLFDSTTRHWAHSTILPKTVLSFDISKKL
jgi:hypothetical protein